MYPRDYKNDQEDESRPDKDPFHQVTFPLWGDVVICHSQSIPGFRARRPSSRAQRRPFLLERASKFNRAFNFIHGCGPRLFFRQTLK